MEKTKLLSQSNQSLIIELTPDPHTESKQKFNPAAENYRIKYNYFFEFFLYYAIEVLLGPFSIMLYHFIPDGMTLAGNLKILGPNGKYHCLSICIYLLRAYFVFFAFYNQTIWKEFFTLLFNDVTLIVLYSTYFSSFKGSDIKNFRKISNYDNTNHDMPEIFRTLLEDNKDKFYQRETIIKEFPNIDFKTFYFYIRKGSHPLLEAEMEEYFKQNPNVKKIASYMNQYNDCVMIDGIIFCKYVVNISDDTSLKYKTKIAKLMSKLLVLSRFIFPFIQDILNDNTFAYFKDYDYALYVLSMICMVILVFRASVTYDTIFLGLISYLFKLKLLMTSNNLLKEGSEGSLYTLIPENFSSWYSLRQILARLNQQFYSLVDTIISFIVLFILIDAVYIISTAFLGISYDFVDIILKNDSFKIIIDQNKLAILFVLYYGLKTGYKINEYYDYDKAGLIKLKQASTQLSNYMKFYARNLDDIQKKSTSVNDKYPALIKEFMIILYNDDGFEGKLSKHLKRINDMISKVLVKIEYETKNFPHTLLGFQTNENLVLNIMTIMGLFGISSARDFV